MESEGNQSVAAWSINVGSKLAQGVSKLYSNFFSSGSGSSGSHGMSGGGGGHGGGRRTSSSGGGSYNTVGTASSASCSSLNEPQKVQQQDLSPFELHTFLISHPISLNFSAKVFLCAN